MDNETMQTGPSAAGDPRPMERKPVVPPTVTVANKMKKMISVKLIVLVAVVVILGILAYMYRSLVVAATVNGHMISRLAVVRELEKESGKKTLDKLITEQLINDEAAKKGVMVTSSDVDAEIKKIEAQFAAQGGTLDQALAAQSMTRDDLTKQITTQKKVEKILADKTAVSDADVDTYIKDNKVTLPKGKETETRDQIKRQLQQEKFSKQAQAWVADLHTQAKINYIVKY